VRTPTWVVLPAVLVASLGLWAAAPGAHRTVAVGDVHGSIDGLSKILRVAELVDDDLKWTGGDATLVQLGDLLDRGVLLREVIELLMRLQQEAPASGGRVTVLLGNHETMNLLGITRDVNRDAYGEFVDQDSEDRRRQAFATYTAFWRRRAAELGLDATISAEAEEQWMEIHPLGFFEYVEAFGPNGRYGAWLRERPAAVVVDNTLFIHGGYGPFLTGVSVAEINSKVAAEIAEFDLMRAWMVAEGLALPWYSSQEMTREAQREVDAVAAMDPATVSAERRERVDRLLIQWSDWYLNHPEGPFWFRGTARWNEDAGTPIIADLLDDLGVVRQVVGHTPQASQRIQPRFDDRVFLIDTGMLEAVYGGTPSALEITGETVVAIYPEERQILVDCEIPPSPKGQPTPNG